MITYIRTALTKLGYKVHQTRQEKIGTGELVVILDDVSIAPLETSKQYIATCWVLIEWDTMQPDNIPTTVATLAYTLENKISETTGVPCKATFKFIQSEVNQLGLMYRVTMTIEYLEEINLD